MKKDVLIVGGGIAGMAYAVRLKKRDVDRRYRIRILSKAPVDQSNSFAAQGGVAAVIASQDSVEQHVKDTLTVGGGRCIPSVVERVVEEGAECINELIHMGARFDAGSDGILHLTNEGGHSFPRVVHHLDRTGAEIVRTLLAQVRALDIEVLPWQRALDLLTVEHRGTTICTGVRTMHTRSGRITDHFASVVVLATGGAGQVYHHTTNPAAATGDGIAMALRAGVPVRDMAFVQFHPTALYTGGEGTAELVSEAVRGAGAILRDRNGIAFMNEIHPMADLAPRNVVARAIHRRMLEEGSKHVWLDAGPIGVDSFARRFPAIAASCNRHGIVPGRDMIPVMPAAHYLCGGIRTDDRGHTAMEGSLALGECASTGLHGADRLASNSLLEALVLAKRAADHTIAHTAIADARKMPAPPVITRKSDPWMQELRSQMRMLMTRHLGIIRTREGMAQAKSSIEVILDEVNARWRSGPVDPVVIELRDLATVAWAIADGALREKQIVGTHWVEEKADQMIG